MTKLVIRVDEVISDPQYGVIKEVIIAVENGGKFSLKPVEGQYGERINNQFELTRVPETKQEFVADKSTALGKEQKGGDSKSTENLL